jgi:hypothetical protein
VLDPSDLEGRGVVGLVDDGVDLLALSPERIDDEPGRDAERGRDELLDERDEHLLAGSAALTGLFDLLC